MTHFKNILLVFSAKSSSSHLATLHAVKELLKGQTFQAHPSEHLTPEMFADLDLVITLGGDGTIIKSASFIKDSTPVLGINSEPESSEGALATLLPSELCSLSAILDGKYTLSSLPRIQVKRNGTLLPQVALNDVYVGTENQFHVSRYVLAWNSNKEEHRSSGVLIVTPAGSHAWYKSAGGIPFHGDHLAFIIREPYTGKSLYKPKILHGRIFSGEHVSLLSKRSHGGIIALDSHIIFPFNDPDQLEISLSPYPLTILLKK